MDFPKEKYEPYLDRLKIIYAEMDHAYQSVADRYDFHCRGCEENCCLTRFYHHTWLEYLYLREGFFSLAPDTRQRLRRQAQYVLEKTAEADRTDEPVRVMCPANEDVLCLLYDYRPMICRLHGIAHELHRPGGPVAYGPGCDAFARQTEGRNYLPFDRTPCYKEMARLESELKAALHLREKIRMTVAEMILSFPETE